MSDTNKEIFTYKGFPLVRKKDELYYGNMSDDFVVMMQVIEKKKVGDMEVATKIKLYKMSTDESKTAFERVSKTSEKEGLYAALDVAYAWLS
ncbi:MAG: hypothetical protein IKJ47_01780 [Oscillospiraceae bacterium]|nr:hypothetical protein [Oscillospiraceae bacterium]